MEEVLKPVSVSYGFTTLIRVSAVLCYNNLLWIGTSQVCTLSIIVIVTVTVTVYSYNHSVLSLLHCYSDRYFQYLFYACAV